MEEREDIQPLPKWPQRCSEDIWGRQEKFLVVTTGEGWTAVLISSGWRTGDLLNILQYGEKREGRGDGAHIPASVPSQLHALWACVQGSPGLWHVRAGAREG